MLFSSLYFVMLFLPISITIYYLIPKRLILVRNIALTLISIAFYSLSEKTYIIFMLVSILLHFVFSIMIDATIKNSNFRKVLLIINITIDIAILIYWKIRYNQNGIIPLGISFYTFQALSYTIDVYRGENAIRNPIDLALYISFFPQLIAGPIVRFKDFHSQLHQRDMGGLLGIAEGMKRFSIGFCKKILLANTMGELVNTVFSYQDYSQVSVLMVWLGMITYALQIYYDFSGYSDMAIGLSAVFGFQIKENFNRPYMATSITDFWRRWHISLSSWFREYIYIPLGGSRCGKSRTVINLFVVWVVTALWHGFNATFLFWGVSYFGLIVLEKYVIGDRINKIAQRIITLLLITYLWTVFRSNCIQEGLRIIGASIGLSGNPLVGTDFLFNIKSYGFPIVAGVLLATNILGKLSSLVSCLIGSDGFIFMKVVQWFFITVLFVISVIFVMNQTYNPFLYFMF